MNWEQQELVRRTFGKLAPNADIVATVFYAFLFELDPDLRPLFKSNMSRQRELLMTMIGAAVDNLHQLEKVTPAIRALGQRHAGYGVRETDYDTVGSALLLTLAQSLGRDFTPEVRAAWVACYETLAEAMQSDVRVPEGGFRGTDRTICAAAQGALGPRRMSASSARASSSSRRTSSRAVRVS
jgi:hemoglobin-like flavoprotein